MGNGFSPTAANAKPDITGICPIDFGVVADLGRRTIFQQRPEHFTRFDCLREGLLIQPSCSVASAF